MWLIKNSPVWNVADEGAGGDTATDTATTTDTSATEAKADTSEVMYPDDQADKSADTDVKNSSDASDDASGDKAADDTAGKDGAEADEWKPYEDDPAKTAEENDAARLENDLKHPINQVPEDGVYNLTMPDGIEVDQELIAGLGSTFKDLNISNGNAQALADKFIEVQQAKAQKATENWAKTVTGWLDSAKNDPDMGGGNWDATARDASSVVTRFGTPELKEYLEASGAGNHPEIIRLMAKVGSMIAEDKPAISETPGQKATSQEVLYPNDKPKGK